MIIKIDINYSETYIFESVIDVYVAVSHENAVMLTHYPLMIELLVYFIGTVK
jgi:hypothetical protein